MPEQQAEVLEKGNIDFFYRPKKGVLHPHSPDDLERVYFMLLPDDQKQHRNRLFNVAHGAFPEIVPGRSTPEERDWAFVQDVSANPKELLDDLEANVQAPPTPEGTRARPWARAAGEGRYAIARHGNHTHLAYFLHEPHKPGPVQAALQIKPEASYILSVKDPYSPSEIRLDHTPNYPANLRQGFDGRGFISADPTELLDYQWAQVLLVGARTDVQKELGLTLAADEENRAERGVLQLIHKEEREAGATGVSLEEPMAEGKWE